MHNLCIWKSVDN